MTAKDEHGWWEVGPGKEWTCPECKATTPVEDWADQDAYCEDCGEHAGRRCPACDEILDHVWGAPRIAEASGLTQ